MKKMRLRKKISKKRNLRASVRACVRVCGQKKSEVKIKNSYEITQSSDLRPAVSAPDTQPIRQQQATTTMVTEARSSR